MTAWVAVCQYSRLEPERGVAAYLDGVQVAIFRTHNGALHAIDNRDPFSGACVLSRGIVGTRGTGCLSSPMDRDEINSFVETLERVVAEVGQ